MAGSESEHDGADPKRARLVGIARSNGRIAVSISSDLEVICATAVVVGEIGHDEQIGGATAGIDPSAAPNSHRLRRCRRWGRRRRAAAGDRHPHTRARRSEPGEHPADCNRGHDSVRARIDVRNGSATGVERPHAPRADGQLGRSASNRHRRRDRLGVRIDSRDAVVESVGCPDTAEPVRDRRRASGTAASHCRHRHDRDCMTELRIEAQHTVVDAARDPDRTSACGEAVDRVAVTDREPLRQMSVANQLIVNGVRPDHSRSAVDGKSVGCRWGEEVSDEAGMNRELPDRSRAGIDP